MEATKVKYMICHDGSQASSDALDTVRYGLLRDQDTIFCAHVWSVQKEKYLDYRMKEKYIHEQLDANLLTLGHQYHYHSEMMDEDAGETAKEKLNQIARDHQSRSPDVNLIMCVGFHGRKGPKEDPTIMGSAVRYMSMNCPTPILIIKDPHSLQNREVDYYRYACCVDGSRKSLQCIETICDMKKPGDHITVIICEQSNIDSDKIAETVLYKLEERGVDNEEDDTC